MEGGREEGRKEGRKGGREEGGVSVRRNEKTEGERMGARELIGEIN